MAGGETGGLRRFWEAVTVVPAGDGHGIRLDGRPLHTPARAPLVLPTRAFAEAVAEEWRAQGETLDPAAMPLTRIANTAIDRVEPQHGEVARIVAVYGESDLLCYRAGAPRELCARQQAWDGPLNWAAETLGVRLAVTTGVIPVAQDAGALAVLGLAVAAFDPLSLAALHDLVALSGSLILGLAVAAGALTPDAAWRLSRLDEDFEIERWGADDEAEAVTAARARAFGHAARAVALTREP